MELLICFHWDPAQSKEGSLPTLQLVSAWTMAEDTIRRERLAASNKLKVVVESFTTFLNMNKATILPITILEREVATGYRETGWTSRGKPAIT